MGYIINNLIAFANKALAEELDKVAEEFNINYEINYVYERERDLQENLN